MSNKIIETMARVDCDTSHIQGFLYGDHLVIRDLSKCPGEQEIFRASIADCSNEQFAIECSLACRRVEMQTIIATLKAAGYAIVRREPDEAMLEAGSTARCYREDGERDDLTDNNSEATWRAMIAAQEQKP
jgi:hypothetical protein